MIFYPDCLLPIPLASCDRFNTCNSVCDTEPQCYYDLHTETCKTAKVNSWKSIITPKYESCFQTTPEVLATSNAVDNFSTWNEMSPTYEISNSPVVLPNENVVDEFLKSEQYFDIKQCPIQVARMDLYLQVFILTAVAVVTFLIGYFTNSMYCRTNFCLFNKKLQKTNSTKKSSDIFNPSKSSSGSNSPDGNLEGLKLLNTQPSKNTNGSGNSTDSGVTGMYLRGTNSIPTTPLTATTNDGRFFSTLQHPNNNINRQYSSGNSSRPGSFLINDPYANSNFNGHFNTIGHGGMPNAYKNLPSDFNLLKQLSLQNELPAPPPNFHIKQESNVSKSEYRDQVAPLGLNFGTQLRTRYEPTVDRPNNLSISMNSGLLNSQTLPHRRHRLANSQNGIPDQQQLGLSNTILNTGLPLGVPNLNPNQPNHHYSSHTMKLHRNSSFTNPTSQNYRKTSAPSAYTNGRLDGVGSPTSGQKLAHVSTPSGSQINGFSDTLTRSRGNPKPVPTPMAPVNNNPNSDNLTQNIQNLTNNFNQEINQAVSQKHERPHNNLDTNSRNSSCSSNSSGINSANHGSDNSRNHNNLTQQNSNSSTVYHGTNLGVLNTQEVS